MRFSTLARWASAASLVAATPLNEEQVKRDTPGFTSGQPIDGKGKGGPILSKTRYLRQDFTN